MHHPRETASVAALHAGYGTAPAWDERRRAMLARCEQLRQRCAADGDVDAERTWAARLATTSSWDAAGEAVDRRPGESGG